MNSNRLRLRKIQMLAHEIMDEVNLRQEHRPTENLTLIIDRRSDRPLW